MTKQIVTAYRALRAQTLILRVACLLAFFSFVQMASATDPDLFADAGTEITANKAKLITLLGVIFTVVLAFVVFKLVKRGTNKV